MKRVIIIAGDKRMTQLMQNADLFEKFKVLGEVYELELTLIKEGDTWEAALQRLYAVYEEAGFIISAMFIPGDPIWSYVNPDVKVFSNGKQWCVLQRVLNQLNYIPM